MIQWKFPRNKTKAAGNAGSEGGERTTPGVGKRSCPCWDVAFGPVLAPVGGAGTRGVCGPSLRAGGSTVQVPFSEAHLRDCCRWPCSSPHPPPHPHPGAKVAVRFGGLGVKQQCVPGWSRCGVTRVCPHSILTVSLWWGRRPPPILEKNIELARPAWLSG